MFRLTLILFGADALIRRWRFFMATGVLTMLVAAITLIDLFDGVADLASWTLGALLLVQGVVELAIGATHTRARRGFEMLRGAAMGVFGCLLLDFPWDNAIASGVIFASAFAFNGLLRIGASLLIRHANWRQSIGVGCGYLLLALLLVTSWPLPDRLNVSFCVGLAFMAGGYVLVRGAWRLKNLPAGSRLAAIDLYRRQRPHIGLNGQMQLADDSLKLTKLTRRAKVAASAASADMAVTKQSDAAAPDDGSMVVHVWTAIGQAANDRIRLPIIDRYIFALTRKGSVSTGHVALACGALYISHHPRVRLEITRENLFEQVQAVSDNNHPGMWLPSYEGEASATRPSTLRIRFRVFNPAYLEAFFAEYRRNDTYNLTSRNCSVAVTEAIDAALEGVFAHKPFWPTLLRLALNPDMWLAGSIRVRAESMAWTPGLALDYAAALRRITHPRQQLGVHLMRWWKARKRHDG